MLFASPITHTSCCQVVIIPIPKANTPADQKAAMYAKVEEFKEGLEAAGVRVVTDARENYTPGWKYNHWELKVRCLV